MADRYSAEPSAASSGGAWAWVARSVRARTYQHAPAPNTDRQYECLRALPAASLYISAGCVEDQVSGSPAIRRSAATVQLARVRVAIEDVSDLLNWCQIGPRANSATRRHHWRGLPPVACGHPALPVRLCNAPRTGTTGLPQPAALNALRGCCHFRQISCNRLMGSSRRRVRR